MAPGTNLVLILVDQWRADALGIMGHPVVETPNLDNLFAGGTVFDRAYASVPSCIAARASLMTGLDQAHHGRVGYMEGASWDYEHTLAGLLGQAGYQTHCVGKMHVWPPRNRVGYDAVELHDGYLHHTRSTYADHTDVDDYLPWLRGRVGATADYVDAGAGCNGYAVRPWPYADLEHPSAWVASQGIDFLRRRDPTRPFFLTLSFHRPHPPLDPPQWALDVYRDVDVDEPVLGDWVDTDRPITPFPQADSPMPDDRRVIDRARRGYLAQLTFIDNQLNRLVHALEERGVWGNTAVLFVADHGELLYDHRHVGKGNGLEGSARVPFMLRMPGPPSAGLRVDEPVELRDVLPTLLDLAGVDCPDAVDGVSVAGWGAGGAVRRTLHGEHSGFVAEDNHWLTDGRTKYLRWTRADEERLFDLDADPREEHDLSAEQPDRLVEWRRRLTDVLADRPEGFVRDGALVTDAVSTPVIPGSPIDDEETQERQRTIVEFIRGYLDPDAS